MLKRLIRPLLLSLTVPMLLSLAACGQEPLGRLVVLNSLAGNPSLSVKSTQDARMFIKVVNEAPPAGGYGVQNLGGAAGYQSVVLTLTNATLLRQTQNKTVNLNAGSADPDTVAAAFTGLKAGGGYALSVSLMDTVGGGGNQVGSGVLNNITLAAGTQAVKIIIAADGSLKVEAAGANEVTDGLTIVKGDTVTFSTGFANDETGVERIDMQFDADLYTGGPAVVASYTRSNNHDKFSNFNTGTDSTSQNGASFTAANFKATAGAGTLTFILRDAGGNEVGRSVLDGVTVVEGATVNVDLQ